MRSLARHATRLKLAAFLVAGFGSAAPDPPAVDSAGFDAKVKPILKNMCSGCHNPTVMSGGVNLLPYLDASTVFEDRAAWEKIAEKIDLGEMPPKGAPRLAFCGANGDIALIGRVVETLFRRLKRAGRLGVASLVVQFIDGLGRKT